MLVGTSGVGKTETALALAELLYGGEQNVTVINMSEFKEEHNRRMGWTRWKRPIPAPPDKG